MVKSSNSLSAEQGRSLWGPALAGLFGAGIMLMLPPQWRLLMTHWRTGDPSYVVIYTILLLVYSSTMLGAWLLAISRWVPAARTLSERLFRPLTITGGISQIVGVAIFVFAVVSVLSKVIVYLVTALLTLSEVSLTPTTAGINYVAYSLTLLIYIYRAQHLVQLILVTARVAPTNTWLFSLLNPKTLRFSAYSLAAMVYVASTFNRMSGTSVRPDSSMLTEVALTVVMADTAISLYLNRAGNGDMFGSTNSES